MAYPVTLNGRTYTLADFEGQNYVDGLPDAFEDFVTHAGNLYSTTSTTSNSIGTGSKTFTVESSKPYQVGTPLRITDSAAPTTNWMDGIVTAYSGTTLTVSSVSYAGSGTKTSWNINIGGGAVSYTGTLPVTQGGTGATTGAAAASNLGVYTKTEADSRFLNVSGEADDVIITSNRVAMGPVTPEVNLHISQTTDTAILRLQRTGAVNAADAALGQIEFYNSDGSSDGPNVSAKITGATYSAGGGGGILQFFTHDGSEGGEGSDPVEAMRIDGNYRVGIGTTNPQALLHIEDTSATAALQIEAANDSTSAVYFADPDGSNPGYISYAHSSDKMLFGAGSEESFRINPEGGVEFRAYNNNSAVFTASISGSVMTVTAVSTGTLVEGAYIFGPTTLSVGPQHDTKIVSFGTGTGGVGTYNLNKSHDVASRTLYQADQNKKDGNRITFYDSDGGVLGGQPLGTIEWKSNDAQSNDQVVSFIGSHVNDGTPDANIIFGIKQNSIDPGDATEKMRLWYNGNLDLSAGGGGIIFDSVGANSTSNTLDYYEEGTWTPIVADTSGGGNTASSYTTNSGFYTRIGRQVTVHCTLTNINTTGMTASNGLYIQGLPFAFDSTTGRNCTGPTRCDRVNVASDCFGVVALVSAGSSTVQIFQNRDNLQDEILQISALVSGQADLFFTLTYETA